MPFACLQFCTNTSFILPVTVDKSMNSLKTQKQFVFTQIVFRTLAIAAVLAASWLMFTSKQTAEVYGIVVDARYSYSPAFMFFAVVNLVACVVSVVTLILAFTLRNKAVNPTFYFYVFLHDLIITLFLIAAFSATAAVAYIGKYGNDHTGWSAICDHFTKLCNKILVALIMSFLGVVLYLILTILSATKSRQVPV